MDDPPTGHARRYGRATFFGVTALGLSSLFWGDRLWRRVDGAAAPLQSVLPDDLVPTGGWRIYTVAPTMPHFEPATWRLRVGGLVQRPLSLSYDELRALPRAEQVSDFHCVTGWTVRNVHWAGVRLEDVLGPARPLASAHGLRFTSAEQPYVDSLTRAQAGLADVLLAYELDGKPLPREHGAPVRLVIPEMYGYKNVKWVERIDLVPKAEDGFWEVEGYDRDAWVGRSNGYSS
jgi:DMSO/TMAO reductase YedYZ molybdopterin-dependent catalytic subunit